MSRGAQRVARDRDAPLFVVRRPMLQWVLWSAGGWVIVVIGVVVAVSDQVSGKAPDLSWVAFTAVFICGPGCLLILAARGLRGSRIEGYERHLVVRSGIRRRRIVTADEIASLRSVTHSQGGGAMTFTSIIGRSTRNRQLFRAFTSYVEYDALVSWLETCCPEAWARYAGVELRH